MNKSFWRTRTFWGALITAGARVVLAPTNADKAGAVAEGVGIVLGAVGVRSAIAKNGTGK